MAFAVPVYHSLLVLFSYGGRIETPPMLRSKSHGIPIQICEFKRNGCEIYGEVHNCVISAGVTIEEGAVVRDSIIMSDCTIGKGCVIDKSIIAENTKIGEGAILGIGSEEPNKLKPAVYSFGLVTIGENSVIPDHVQIGKNTAISGITNKEDYPDGVLGSGETLIKAGEIA